MSFFDKIAFWKKDDDPLANLDTDFTKPLSATGAPPSTFDSNFSQTSYGQQNNNFNSQSFGQSSFGSSNSGFGQNNFEVRPVQQPQSPSMGNMDHRELEIVSSKLDAIKAMLESINQRLANVERIAMAEETDARKRQRGW